MPTTTLTAQQIVSITGLTPVFAAPANADVTWANTGREYIEVINTGAELTLTINTPALVEGLAVAENIITIVLTTGHKKIGPFPAVPYNQAGGMVTATFGRITDMTCGLFRL
jgi:hypothetical protein